MKKSYFLMTLVCTSALLANPSGAEVKSGSASMQTVGQLLEVKAADRSIIHWNDFSIQIGETTRFVQPSSSSTVLNRVTGLNASMINGVLEANGRVFLVNPHGVLVGKEGVIKTAEFIASTCDILNMDDGSIYRDGSQLSFEGADMAALINLEGVIEATGVDRSGGRVLLLGPDLKIDGQVLASGGRIELLGNQIELQSQAHIDVSSSQGGGVVLVGGDFQGKNPDVYNSQSVLVHPGTLIDASGRGDGNGGRVILWSDKSTSCLGTVLARGGQSSGDGGFIEISSKGGFKYGGGADAAAVRGRSGTLLFDPSTITINGSPSSPAFTPTYNPAVPTATIDVADILTALGGNNVIISTSNGSGGTGDITWDPLFPITWLTSNSLTLNADNNILLGSDITCTSTGNITMNAGNNISIAANIASTGGNLSFISSSPTGTITVTSGAATPSDISTTVTGTLFMQADRVTVFGSSLGGNSSLGTQDGALTVTAGSINLGDSSATGTSRITTTTGTLTLQASGLLSSAASTVANVVTTIFSTTGTINLSGDLIDLGTGGQQGPASVISNSGTINVNAVTGIKLLAGANSNGFTQIVNNTVTSPINVTVTAGNLDMSSITGTGANAIIGQPLATGGPVNIIITSGDINMSCNGTNNTVMIGSQNLVAIQADNMNMICNGQGSQCRLDVNTSIPTTISTIDLTGNFSANAIGGGANNPRYVASFQNSILHFSCLGDFTLDSSSPVSFSGFSPLGGSLSGVATFDIGGNATITTSGNAPCAIQIGSVIPLFMTIDGNLTIQDTLQGQISVACTENFDLIVNGDMLLQATNDPNSNTLLGVLSAGSPYFHTVVGGSINLGNKGFVLGADDGDVSMMAGVNMTMGPSAGIGTTNPPGPNAALIIVVDNQNPFAPVIGPGAFTMDATASIYSNLGANIPPVQIFTARQSQNSILGTINTASFVPGPFNVNSSEERWGVYYPQSFVGSPFTVFYKEPQSATLLPPAFLPPLTFQRLAVVIGNMYDVLGEFEYPLPYYKDQFCLFYCGENGGSSSCWSHYPPRKHYMILPNDNCYQTQILNYRKFHPYYPKNLQMD
jgi:filamentous hemagglutinin family protein